MEECSASILRIEDCGKTYRLSEITVLWNVTLCNQIIDTALLENVLLSSLGRWIIETISSLEMSITIFEST
jgi:hypothetical protein